MILHRCNQTKGQCYTFIYIDNWYW